MAGRIDITVEEEDDALAAARWVLAIEEGLEPQREQAFHTWLAARPERAELIARAAALPELAREAEREAALDAIAARRVREQALRSRRRFVMGGAIAAGLVAAAGAAVMMRAPWLDTHAAYETAVGEVRAVDLPDGSKLWLDTQTKLSTHMTRARRDVTLEAGRLFVEVADAPERPFRVHGTLFEARAVGTAFEVTAFEGRTGVAVTEGVVRLTLENGGPAIRLAAGESAWISGAGEVTRVSLPAAGAWREYRMVLSDQRLDAALAELSRYFDRPLTTADEQLAGRRVGLSFSIAGLKAEDAARILADAIGADVADQASAGVALRPLEHAPPSPR